MRLRTRWQRHASVAVSLAVTLGVGLGQPVAAHGASSSSVTTCAVLSSGATGPAVTAIRAALGLKAGRVFGSGAAKALRTWQKAHSVPATGVVDAATWAALPASVGQAGCGARVRGTGVTLTCASLSSGSTGLAVAVLQRMVGTTVNGTYGGPTVDAVKNVQKAAKLPQTGTTSPATWKALTLFGTPECSTSASVAPRHISDAAAQAKVRKRVATLYADLLTHPGATTNPVALQAMAFAKRQIGKPYVWGATGPKGYDCSGLQMTSYRHAGLSIPRTSAEQYAGAGTYVPLNRARQGDLLFYASDVSKPSTVYHVAMYVGNGKLLDAPQTGEDVQISPMWTTDLLPVVVRPVAALKLPVKLGAKGWTVTQLQQALNRHGAGLGVDGGFGPSTDAAVRAWQTAHKLPANGVVDVTTWLSLK